MKNLTFIFILLLINVNAQISTGIPADTNNNIIANFSSNNRAEIKGFSIPNYNLTTATNFLGDTDATNMRNSLLIFNSGTNKGLYFWDKTQWTILADKAYLSKLTNLSAVKVMTSQIVNPISYTMGNDVGAATNHGQHTIGENYTVNSANWTDLLFQDNTTSKLITIKNTNNVNKLTLTGALQMKLPSAPTTTQRGLYGLALFIQYPNSTDFLLVDYKIISTYITNNVCAKIQFDLVNFLRNLPIGDNTVRIAIEKREVWNTDISSDNGKAFTVNIGQKDATCTSSTASTQRQQYLPSSAATTKLIIETYENPSF